MSIAHTAKPTIPVKKTLLADLGTPVTAYLKLSEKSTPSFLPESVEGARPGPAGALWGGGPAHLASQGGGTHPGR